MKISRLTVLEAMMILGLMSIVAVAFLKLTAAK